MSKLLTVTIRVSDKFAALVSKDFEHMQTAIGQLSWVKLTVNGDTLTSWEVTDGGAEAEGTDEAIQEAEEA